jgi:leucine dehydrogenase
LFSIICGAANNQLADSTRDGDALHQRGILYCPDFVVNRMGIVNCAHEDSGNFGNTMADPEIVKHFSESYGRGVFAVTTRVLEESKRNNLSTDAVAKQLADQAATVAHPIWPHRQRSIIRSLLADEWHKQK